MEQIHRTIKKARATFPPGGDAHKEFLNALQREGAINCRMAFFMKQLIENPNMDYEVDEKGTLRIGNN